MKAFSNEMGVDVANIIKGIAFWETEVKFKKFLNYLFFLKKIEQMRIKLAENPKFDLA